LSIDSQIDNIPPHSGLGELTISSMDKEGYIKIYRPCLYRWSEEQMEEYELLNDKCFFGWCVYGEEPIYGVMTFIKGEDK